MREIEREMMGEREKEILGREILGERERESERERARERDWESSERNGNQSIIISGL